MCLENQNTRSPITSKELQVKLSEKQKDFKLKTDKEIVKSCMEGQEEAWNEFFSRFIPIFIRSIKMTLKAKNNILCNYDEVLDDISEKLIVKFYKKGLLLKCPDITGIRTWIKVVASNQAKDWLKQRNRLKNRFQQQIETSMRSLNESSLVGSSIDFSDINVKNSNIRIEPRQHIEEVLSLIEQQDKTKINYWIIRLSILHYMPLTKSEITNLTDISPLNKDDIKCKLHNIVTELEINENKQTNKLYLSYLLWNKMLHLEFKLKEIENEDTSQSAMYAERIRLQIYKEALRRDKLLAAAKANIRPSNLDIAALVGIASTKVGFVSTVLSRFRKKMRGDACR